MHNSSRLSLLLLSLFSPIQGVSDFASFREDGTQEEEEVVFPWCLALVPVALLTRPSPSASASSTVFRASALKQNQTEDVNEEDKEPETQTPFITQLLRIPKDSVIYDIYCIPTPNCLTEKLQNLPHNVAIERVGRICTTSEFVQTTYDQQIFFKHQRKEEDYVLRPEWLEDLQTVHANTGSSFFETHIQNGKFVDFEKSI